MNIFEIIFGFKNKRIELLENANKILSKENEELQEEANKLNINLYSMQEKINLLKEDIKNLTKAIITNPKEEELNNKYPKFNLTYERTETDGKYQIDVKNFVSMYDDYTIPLVSGENDDERALNGLKWVINNIDYISDGSSDTYKQGEYWAYPYQTLKHKQGDCEDGAILLYCILIKSGIPYWKVRVSAGDTTAGGHAYITYYDEKKDRWVSLDWCFYPNTLPIEKRTDYKDEIIYKNIWFSFNHLYSYATGIKSGIKGIILKNERN